MEQFFSHAIRDALREEMMRDPDMFLMGEDIGLYGGAFGVTKGLIDEFGPRRVRNTPISENSVVGAAVGAALMGSRPVVEIMFMDFILLAADQILNHAGKYHFMYGDQARVPMVIRAPMGGGRGYGPTHSQCLERLFVSMPGIKVVAPSTPADAKGLLKAAIRDDNPVLFLEDKRLYPTKGNVPEGDGIVPLGKASVVRPGGDVTVVSYAHTLRDCLTAADAAANEGIGAEVIDLRSLSPLDDETILESVGRTGRLVVAEEGHRTGGIGAEIACRVMEKLYYYLDAPIQRVAARDVPIPASPMLEDHVLPAAGDVLAAIRNAVSPEKGE